MAEKSETASEVVHPSGKTQVRDIMSNDVATVGPKTPVGEALNQIYQQKVSALPVVDGDRCVGIITATDLVVLLRGIDKTLSSDYPHYQDCYWVVDLVQQRIHSDPVRDIMSELVFAVSPNDSVAEAARLMQREGIHHLPVVEDDKLIGFVSSLDFTRVLA